MGSTVDQQPEGEVVRQSQEEVARRAKFFQPTQPIPKPNCDRSGQPDNRQDVFIVQGETSRSQEIDVKFFARNSVLQIDQGNLINAAMDNSMKGTRMEQMRAYISRQQAQLDQLQRQLPNRPRPLEVSFYRGYSRQWRRSPLQRQRGALCRVALHLRGMLVSRSWRQA